MKFATSPTIVNKYTCLAIEAVNAYNFDLKYFEYNKESKMCKLLKKPYPQYKSCESVTGNSNICLGLTEKLYCRWDVENLKCVTIT